MQGIHGRADKSAIVESASQHGATQVRIVLPPGDCGGDDPSRPFDGLLIGHDRSLRVKSLGFTAPFQMIDETLLAVLVAPVATAAE